MQVVRRIACLLAAWCTCVAAADSALDVSQYRRSTWNARDGFVDGARIVTITQTPDGWLWLGTDRGLFRFDGMSATRWRPPNGTALPDESITAVFGARDGTLWIGTIKGLARWRDGAFAIQDELSGYMIDYMLEDREGKLWIATQRIASPGLLCALRAGTLHCEGADGRFGRYVGTLFEDRAGALWVKSSTGLWRWRPVAPAHYPADPGDSFGSLAAGDDGGPLLAAGRRVHRIVGDRLEPVAWLPPEVQATKILRDRRGAIWIGTLDSGLVHVHDGRIDAFNRADGYAPQQIGRMFEDREGNIWVANSDGLERFTEASAAVFSWRQGLANRGVSAVVAGRDGSIWLATLTGLYRLRNGAVTVYRERAKRVASGDGPAPFGPHASVIANGTPEDYVSIFEDSRGRLWIGSSTGSGYLSDDRFVRLTGIPRGYIDAIAEDADGNVWLSHRDVGLLRWTKHGSLETITWSQLGHAGRGARLAADPRSGVWIGFASGGIVHWAGGRVLASHGSGEIPGGRIEYLRADPDGATWVASSGGLTRLRNGRNATLDVASGLPCDAVDSMGQDASGAYWLYMACGLARIARADMETWIAAADRGQSRPRVTPDVVLSDADGVRTSPNRGSASPHMALARDGRLWLSNPDGAMVVDPARLYFNPTPPPVHIERIVADRHPHEPSRSLRLPPLVRDIEIKYTALSFTAPERMRFKYKLEGRDRDWIDAGNLRRAFYTDLPPGTYRFRVIAANDSGVWNEQGDALPFSIAPAWWQTAWFRVAALAAAALLLYGMYRSRVAHIARQFNMTLDARINERMRIARELHDTLLQSFHGLLLRFQLAAELLPDRASEAKRTLLGAIDQAEAAITEGRDAVQGLRASSMEVNDLANAIGVLGETLARDSDDPPALRVEVQGASRVLHPILRDEIFRVASEALRNAFHHSAAAHIEIEIRYDPRQLRLRIRDDGRGVAPEVLANGGREGHFGLAGMRERAALIGGKLTLWSAPGAGTEVELAIPASHAYTAMVQPSFHGKTGTRS